VLTFADPLPIRPQRVIVAGVSGAGKTSLARRIAAITGGQHVEIDALFHGPQWTPRPEFVTDVERFTSQPAWTTEWQYTIVRPLVADRADLVVWLDLPFWRVVLPRVAKRTIRRRRHGEVLWNGNVEPPLRTIFANPDHIIRWSIYTRKRTAVQVAAVAVGQPTLTIVRLRSQDQVDDWLAGALRIATTAP
jgi:adenylate kinase family enzyme